MSRSGLTVAMIVRDERENLEELLPVVVGQADDVVVVDTGSGDGTPEVARRLGARVFEQPWNRDFSKARNRGLDEVRTSHVMWLDADDRLSREDLREIRREALRHGNAGLMLRLVNESPDPNRVSTCHQLRVFPARPEHRFRGRIHEQIQPSLAATGTPVRWLDLAIRHPACASDTELLGKARRNLELSRLEYSENRRGIAAIYHYVKAASLCGEIEEAARIARNCVEAPPPDSQPDILQNIAVTLGRLEWRCGRPGEAERVYRQAIERVPEDPFPRYYLGELLRQAGRPEEALEHLRMARSSPPYGTRVPMPVAGLKRAILLELGQVLEMLARPAEAVDVYREGLAGQPGDPALRVHLARALIATGAREEAGRELDVLPEAETETVRVLDLRAGLAFLENRDQEAERLYGKLAGMLPSAGTVRLRLAHLALRNGRAEEAREQCERAIALADTPESRLALAAALLQTGDVHGCVDHLATVVVQCRDRPLPPGIEAISGEAMLGMGRPREALDAFEKHLHRNGPDPRIISRLADCYRQLGEPRAARLGYEEALGLSPGLPEAVRGLEILTRVPGPS